MSTDSKAQRVEIANITVRSLLLMNGGGAVALLTFLGSILGEPELEGLIAGAWWGLLSFHVGLLAAVIHSELRRRCSLAYDPGGMDSDAGVCFWSKTFMWASMALFFAAGVIVGVAGLRVLG